MDQQLLGRARRTRHEDDDGLILEGRYNHQALEGITLLLLGVAVSARAAARDCSSRSSTRKEKLENFLMTISWRMNKTLIMKAVIVHTTEL